MNKNYFTFLMFGFLSLSQIPQLSAQLSGWSRYKALDVINKTSVARTDYQELVILDTKILIDSGFMQSNGADIRFGDKCTGSITIYPHYIMRDINTNSTKIWVKLPSIAANSTTTIFCFYGNSSASSSSSFSSLFTKVRKTNGSNDSIAGINIYEWVEIEADDTLFVKKDSLAQINARVVIVKGAIVGNGSGEPNAGLGAPGKGLGGGGVSSASNAGSGGAGYGGAGGDGGYDAGDAIGYGGTTYGTSIGTEIAKGSAGGSSISVLGGAGGGCLIIKADIIDFGGAIHCDGDPGIGFNGQGSGGGSGGGVMLRGSFVYLNGNITANGGKGGAGAAAVNDDGGGGGGGRIKVFYSSGLFGTLTTSVLGAAGGPNGTAAPGQPGANGSVYQGSLYYQADSIIPTSLDLRLSDVDARICPGTPFTVTSRTGFTSYTFYKNSTQLATGTANSYNYKGLKDKDTLTVVGNIMNCFSSKESVVITVDTNPIVSIESDSALCGGDTLKLLAKGAKTYQWITGPKTDFWNLVPSSSNKYTVIGKDGNNCADTAEKQVNYYTYASYNAPGPETICSGETVQFTVSGCNYVLWDGNILSNSISLKPTTTGYIHYEAYDHSFCRLQDSVKVNVNPKPDVFITGKTTACAGGSATLQGNGALFYQWSTGTTYFEETVYPTVQTTYWVRGKDDKGCADTAYVTVTIIPPVPISISGDLEVCKGESTTLTASGGVSYSWGSGGKNPTETVTPVITTSYPVVSVDSNGCRDTTVTTVVVNLPPVVTLVLPGNMDTMCLSEAATALSGENPSGGTFSGLGVIAGAFTPSVAGIGKRFVRYVYKDSKGCSDSASDFIIVDACAGVDDVLVSRIRIYPNPANDMLYVQAPKGNYILRDVYGRLVLSFEINNNTAALPLNNLSSGSYFIHSQDAGIPVQKMILLR